MTAIKVGGREFRRKVHNLLTQDDFDSALVALSELPVRQTINPLFHFFCSTDELTKWRAVTAVGVLVSGLAQTDMESARVVMRRLMWTLNDESGGIGWGAPEAMAEIMARHKGLTGEYGHILVSYIREDGNYLEHEALQRGVLWGIKRLALTYPTLLSDATPFIAPYLESQDSVVRGLAAMLCGILRIDSTKPILKKLKKDKTAIRLFSDGAMQEYRVDRIAVDALTRL